MAGVFRMRFKNLTLVAPSFLTMLAAVVAFACIYFLVDSFLLMYALISIPHSLQYIGLAYHYHDGKNKRIKLWSRSKENSFFYIGDSLLGTLCWRSCWLNSMNNFIHR
ncbi:hypothetical protein [Effusibacillus consociatus]|uniref:Uncharacterized protein n=1 Tax=Effusibacillus consociatus TaxID=1117041 RepID=A0ABV9QBL7_9BACL